MNNYTFADYRSFKVGQARRALRYARQCQEMGLIAKSFEYLEHAARARRTLIADMVKYPLLRRV